MKNNTLKRIILFIILLPFLFILVYTFVPLEYKIFPRSQTITIELGEELDTNINTYIWGHEKAISQATIDVEQIDIFNAGSYNAYVTLGERAITYTINVVDTTVPKLVLDDEIKFIGIDREYTPQYFVKELFDLSNNVETFFLVDEILQPTICFDDVGNQELTIVAKDNSGNETTSNIIVTIDYGPILIGVEDVIIPTGTTYDVLGGVAAIDEKDGIISSNITTTPSEIDFSKSGTHDITYSIFDSDGIETTKTCKIIVSDDATDDYKYANNLSIDELQLLCDYGYFKYQPLEENDFEKACELVKPTSVNINNEQANGSGFIYKITPEYVYIGSVNHVTGYFNGEAMLWFHNDVSIPIIYTSQKASSSNELSMFKIKTTEIPKDTLLTLKEAYVDFDIYEKLSNREPLIQYCENYRKTNTSRIKQCYLIEVLAYQPLASFAEYGLTTNNVGLYGMSGCPLFDYKGNLIGALSFEYKDKEYHMRIDELENLRQKVDK